MSEQKTELELLMEELRNMKSESRFNVANNRSTWEAIGNKDWESLGFKSIEEMQNWVKNNSYSNI
jgi:hypothetical protein